MALNLRFIFSRMPSLIPNKPVVKLKQAGVSLLEFVLGLVLLAIVLLGVTLFYANNTRQLDPVFQFRAVSLAEALAEQVLSVKYDAANNPFEQKRCGVDGASACENKPDDTYDKLTEFSQVDDFQLWCNTGPDNEIGPIKGDELAAQLSLARTELYQNFMVETCVDITHVTEDPPYKEVSIKVSINSGADIVFKLQRYNIR
ncbi:type IV pilus modification PilV family protein [Oceanisphaera ostreae]|uniref:Prepilin-type cleavage/methylation-like protein n=1 Tax=Oceanisphaera ostreae TaxID=914151 RepID=A0ABW3KC27_9GAMM